MERLTKETLSMMSKEELEEAVETLQVRLEAAEKELEALKAMAEVGTKYIEHLRQEATRLIRAVEGEDSPVLRLLNKADVDTLKEIVDDYMKRGKEKFKASSKDDTVPEELTKERLLQADYAELLKLKERFTSG